MNEHHMTGAFNEVSGRVQGATGALADDAATELKGKARQAAGRLENAYGDAMDAASGAGESMVRAVRSNPTAAILTAAGVGFIVGWVLHRD